MQLCVILHLMQSVSLDLIRRLSSLCFRTAAATFPLSFPTCWICIVAQGRHESNIMGMIGWRNACVYRSSIWSSGKNHFTPTNVDSFRNLSQMKKTTRWRRYYYWKKACWSFPLNVEDWRCGAGEKLAGTVWRVSNESTCCLWNDLHVIYAMDWIDGEKAGFGKYGGNTNPLI